MYKRIRVGIFETNSSSTHSIHICIGEYKADELPVDDEGNITIYPGEFGWDHNVSMDAATKAAYCLTWCKERKKTQKKELKMLKDVIEKETGKKVEFEKSGGEYYPWGYIDHQSESECYKAFQSPEILHRFIFNQDSLLVTDNDNH